MNRKIFAFLFLAVFCLSLSAAEKLPYWKDVNVVAVNKEYPRTAFMSYDNAGDAASLNYENSKYYYLLNGTWKFYFVDAYRDLPDNITDPAVSTSNWHDIQVPGNWEVQGFGTAIYTNHGYEFKPRNPTPPLLPEDNPVGVYRRDIEIPADWLDRDLFLHIAGAKSGVYVYLNGREVGYSEDSKNPAEFQINKYVKAGKNVLTMKIFRWSTGSYLECQDFFRISGIERDVFIWSQPKTAVKDFRVISTLDDTYKNGVFKLSVDVKNTNPASKNVTVKYDLLDDKGATVNTQTASQAVPAGDVKTFDLSAELANVKTWTSEHPNLYKVLITVGEGASVAEVVPFHVGFRRIEIKESDHIINGRKQSLFYVNGQPIKLKGTNIHETSENGHYITREQMIRNFELMKLNNINTVRLSHYPQDRKFYELCDIYGLYVYDEANIESHGMYYDLRKGASLGNNPDWLEVHMDRIHNMYERNKNYPSVTIFSLGNEAGNGYNFYQAYLWIKDKDKTLMNRPVCYERALWEWNTDMYVPQYPSAAWLHQIGDAGADRPVVPSEYSHAMGNSNGNLYDQWVEIYQYPHLQGGYIWEWIDHAVKTKDKNGKDFWAYGGDFGVNQPSDGNFVADGLINPNQHPHPAMAEVKYTHQNVGFKAKDLSKGEFEITNRFYFSNLSDYRMIYELYEDSKVIRRGEFPLNIAPQESAVVIVPVLQAKAKPGVEYFVNFRVYSKKAELLVPAGHEVAYDQFQLPVTADKQLYTAKGPKLSVEEDGNCLIAKSSKVNFAFNKAAGMVTSYQVDGREYFKDHFGIQPNFWRGPTDNDYGSSAPQRLQVWKEASKKFDIGQATIAMEGDNALITVNYNLPAGNKYIVKYRVYPTGAVNVAVNFTPTMTVEERAALTEEAATATFSPTAARDRQRMERLEVPRIGVRFRLPATMNQVEYFGRGPEENYADRYKGTLIGRYKALADDMNYPYVRPQETGHHSDTRWLTLNVGKGYGLLIQADETIGFNALRNSVEDFDSEEADADYQWNNFSPEEIQRHNPEQAKNRLRKQTHASDIEPRDFVEVCVDMKQYGLAGYNSWGARPLPEYTIYADQEYNWGFTLVPVSSPADAEKKSGKSYK